MRRCGGSSPVDGADREEKRDTEGPSPVMKQGSRRRVAKGRGTPELLGNNKRNKGNRNSNAGNNSNEKGIKNKSSHGTNSLGTYMRFQQPHERRARNQKRTGQWRKAHTYDNLRSRVRAFGKGTGKNSNQSAPTDAELMAIVNDEHLEANRTTIAARLKTKGAAVLRAKRRQEKAVNSMVQDWKKGGHGLIKEKKSDGTFRIMWENWNSIKLFTEKDNDRINKIDALRRRYNADIIAGCETQVDWELARREKDVEFVDIFGLGENRTGGAAYNSTEHISRCQPGGTAIMSFGRLSGYAEPITRDPRNLGRWVVLTIRNAHKTVRIVMAYRPCLPSAIRRRGTGRAGSTVWEQHDRLIRREGIFATRTKPSDAARFIDPRDLFDKDLLEEISAWRKSDEEVILLGDFNQDVYTGSFAKKLGSSALGMTEQFKKLTESEAPFSHVTGQRPISGVFATAGVECKAAYISEHGVGVGDHRLHIFDFSTESLLGLLSPASERPTARNLQCKSIPRTRVSYNKTLVHLTTRHNMAQKVNELDEQRGVLSAVEYDQKSNAWDKELIELMTASEKICRKIKTDDIPFSPTVGSWRKRINTYRWVIRHKQGKVKNMRNLRYACEINGIEPPEQLSLQDLLLNIRACEVKMEELKLTAPSLRKAHLRDRLDVARQEDNDEGVEAIVRIMRREAKKKQTRRLRAGMGKRRGLPAAQIAVASNNGPDTVFSTQAEVEGMAAKHLTTRFTSAHSAPINSGKLREDIGFLGNTPAVKEILAGTYVYPPDMDKHTRLLLEEAARIFDQTAGDTVSTFVTTKDFQDWWLTCDETIQSSKSGAHFGHYQAAAHDDYLSALHVAKLNLALKSGRPLERWGHGLTVLLEKEFGSIYIDKLRAICLFEADFNWLQKLIFSKRMMTQAKEKDILPPEQAAKPGTGATEGTMLKVLHNDLGRTLHTSSAVVSADLANCYDAVNHAMCSIALQAFGVPVLAVTLMLSCLQTMFFWLRTAFGVAENPFCGTFEFPFLGLGQGSGAAPPSFLATSTLMINGYKRLGHGCRYVSCVSATVFLFAAILYVDDTDLLIQAQRPDTPDEELFRRIQLATDDWGSFARATGGDVKPKKCHVSINSYKFVKGVAILKKKSELPKIPITVSQKDGSRVEIALLDPTESKKTLGVMTNTAGCGKDQIAYMKEKGMAWASNLGSHRFLTPGDGWLSLSSQLKPRVEWGLVSLCADPKHVDEMIHSIYFRSLSHLKVNKNIKKEMRTLPGMFQGLGMFNLNLDCLGSRIYFLRRHWKLPSPIGCMLLQAYECFQMDVGLQGNIFTRNFDELGGLASHSWMKTTWQLCHRFRVEFTVHSKQDIPLLREGDKSIMECIISSGVFNRGEFATLGRFAKHKTVYSLGDLVECDGRRVRPFALTAERGRSKRTFSHEQPTTADHKLWVRAIRHITSPAFLLSPPLGHFLGEPHVYSPWLSSNDENDLFYLNSDCTYDRFSKIAGSRPGRQAKYSMTGRVHDPPSSHKYASVDIASDSTVSLLSSANVFRPVAPSLDFWDVLRDLPNQTLWKYFHCDGDGSWIQRGAALGTLILSHDGSYMQQVDPTVCSAAFKLVCTHSRCCAVGSIVEQSENADNYRAEALGSLAGLLVIHAGTGKNLPYKLVKAYCDNKGIVSHGSNDYPLPEKQAQSDVLSLIKQYIRTLPVKVVYEHVFGHLDDVLRWDQLTYIQQLNVEMDSLAKRSLLSALVNRRFISNDFPFEDLVLKCGGNKVISSPTKALYRWWGSNTARVLFHEQGKIDKSLFNLIYWKGMDKVMTSKFPQMFRVWLTKHVSGCCGVNSHLNYIDNNVKNICPSCGTTGTVQVSEQDGKQHNVGGETTHHITVCPHPHRTKLFHSSVTELVNWMESHDTDPFLAELIEHYLRDRGESTMFEVAGYHIPTRYNILIKYHDKLGWDNFIEGRILSLYAEHQREYLQHRETYMIAESWMTGLMEHLIKIPHRQWLYRNATVHFRRAGGRTNKEHAAITERISDLLWIDPDDLLDEDVALLSEDFERLGRASSTDQEYWVASMEAALLAAGHTRHEQRKRRRATVATVGGNENHPPEIDDEGSLRYRSRKRK